MGRDTFDDAFTCADCGREHLSISGMMSCNCDRYDTHGYLLQGDTYDI